MLLILRWVAIIWILCGVINYSAALAYFQGEFPEIARDMCRKDVSIGLFFGLLGPPATLVLTFKTVLYEHGLQFTCEGKP